MNNVTGISGSPLGGLIISKLLIVAPVKCDSITPLLILSPVVESTITTLGGVK